VESYVEGTGLGIHVRPDGLLWAGSPERNATWMDARTSTGPVTPRAGCAVELQALWYALLDELEELGALAGDERGRASARECKLHAGRAFLERFWLADERVLADVWNGERADTQIRPNMVIAAALEASPLDRAKRAGIVECAERELLTPRGLRTLSPADPAYLGRFEGGPEERDRAYHQGTVWPWLVGFHVEATLRAARDPRAVRGKLEALLASLDEELDRACLGHVSEVFDGDAPRRPGGTFAQAWNTGELLRARALLLDLDAPRTGARVLLRDAESVE
jgi:glycogen debranching enzyme